MKICENNGTELCKIIYEMKNVMEHLSSKMQLYRASTEDGTHEDTKEQMNLLQEKVKFLREELMVESNIISLL